MMCWVKVSRCTGPQWADIVDVLGKGEQVCWVYWATVGIVDVLGKGEKVYRVKVGRHS